MGLQESLSEEAIDHGFRIEKGLIVRYVVDEKGKLTRKRKNWKNSLRGYSRQFIKDECEKCKSTKGLTVDHIKPLSRGGSKEESNCQTLCRLCHDMKDQQHKNSCKRVCNGTYIKGNSELECICWCHRKKKKIVKRIKIKKIKIENTKFKKGLWGEYRIIN